MRPAPMVGFYGDVEVIPKFFLRGDLQMLYINNVAGYGGSVTDNRIAAEYYPFHNYGFGLSYHYVGLTANKFFDDGAELTYKYAIEGPSLYLKAAFGAPSPVPRRSTRTSRRTPTASRATVWCRIPGNSRLADIGPAVNSKMQFTNNSQSGPGLDLERSSACRRARSDIDLHAEFQWGNKNMVTFEYFNVIRRGERTLTDTIHFGDSTYVAGPGT